ncbi:MAG: serine hydrolase [Ruminococcaceae bacterium]|nr:serine hydrolase [Oscillospiraceae bacterium]
MTHVESTVAKLFAEERLRNVAIRAGIGERPLLTYFKSTSQELNESTLFDMASVTKILSVTQLMLIALDRGLIALDTPVSRYFENGGELTVKHLLTHTMGIGHKNLRKDGTTYETVGEYILSLPSDIPIGSDVLYSCPAFILLGKILEQIFGKPLNLLFSQLVADPLGMSRSSFLPTDRQNIVNANQTDDLLGVVNDYNCRHLGGVAGNAGVFSCVADLDRFCHMLLNHGAPLYSEQTFSLSIQNHTPDMSDARGLGYLYVDERYKQTGELFPTGSFGHCGHTGQLLFVDPAGGLYVIILTDATRCNVAKYGHDEYHLVKEMRELLCNAVKADLGL